MKVKYLLSVLILLAFTSCKKDQIVPNQDVQAQLIAEKYHLVLTKSNGASNAKFTSLADFDSYMESKKNLENTYKFQLNKSAQNASLSGKYRTQSTNHNGGYPYGFETKLEPYGNYKFESFHEYDIRFESLISQGFAGLAVLGLEQYGSQSPNVQYFNLLQDGSNLGSYIYNNTSISRHTNNIRINRVYIEQYGVAGMYTYSDNYHSVFTADIDWQSHNMLCALTFTKIN